MNSRHFCFTINKKSTEKVDDFKLIRPDLTHVKYLIMGLEIAPTTRQVHWQGYVVFNTPQKWGKVKKIFSRKDLHVEVTKGTHKQNYEYCTKTGQFSGESDCCYPGVIPFEHGDREKLFLASEKSKSAEIVEQMKTKSKDQVIADNPEYMLAHGKAFEFFCNMQSRTIIGNKAQDRLCIYLQGPTGVGKTWSILQAFDERCYRVIHPHAKKLWLDHYNPIDHPILFLDEFDAEEWNLNELKELIDIYPATFATKGGHVKTNWRICFVASCIKFEAQQWGLHMREIKRRFNLILFDVKGAWLHDIFDEIYPRLNPGISSLYQLSALARKREQPDLETYKMAAYQNFTQPKWYQNLVDAHKRAASPEVFLPPLKRQDAFSGTLAYLDPNGDGDVPLTLHYPPAGGPEYENDPKDQATYILQHARRYDDFIKQVDNRLLDHVQEHDLD